MVRPATNAVYILFFCVELLARLRVSVVGVFLLLGLAEYNRRIELKYFEF